MTFGKVLESFRSRLQADKENKELYLIDKKSGKKKNIANIQHRLHYDDDKLIFTPPFFFPFFFFLCVCVRACVRVCHNSECKFVHAYFNFTFFLCHDCELPAHIFAINISGLKLCHIHFWFIALPYKLPVS